MRIILMLLCAVPALYLSAQTRVGEWRELYAHNQITSFSVSGNMIAAATNNALMWQNADAPPQYYSKLNGLSEIGIATIATDHAQQLVLVAYTNGVIDIITPTNLETIRSVNEKLGQSPQINKIIIHNENAYLAYSFGVIKVNLHKAEVTETYYLGINGSETNVADICYQPTENALLALTNTGIYQGKLDGRNLMNYQNWEHLTTQNFRQIECTNSQIYALSSSSTTSLFTSNNASNWTQADLGIGILQQLHLFNNQLSAVATDQYAILENADWQTKTIANQIWAVAPLTSGELVTASSTEGIAINGTRLEYNGPTSNNILDISARDGSLYAVGNNFASKLRATQWQNSPSQHVNQFVVANTSSAAWLTTSNNELLQWNENNLSIITQASASAIAASETGELWWANHGSTFQVGTIATDGTLNTYKHTTLTTPNIMDMLVLPNNDKWLLDGSRIYAYNEQAEDNLQLFSFAAYDENASLITNQLHCMAYDNDGAVWVGSPKGVLVFANPMSVLAQRTTPIAYRLVGESDGEAAYLLSDKTITDIVVDGSNRKWIATENSGLYYVSSAGNSILESYTKDNSPLPTNGIRKLTLDPSTGELFLLTDYGILGLRTLATQAKENFSQAYAYPNPVRPNFDGNIILAGLTTDCTIKITDTSGRLVSEMQSSGGQASWNGQNLAGDRVVSGVYFAFLSSEDGAETGVVKMLIIR